ncbi:Mg chelatase subunit ChlI [Anopheles sinensis]|uniref:Mg chelatase subunit ChlI n=1 Tax=Anopheles sinensis TaxID=74873 RepID=A0A084VUP6_ANOSI|nr:Mg chelatase subunit ChlI [Anopheles sinensis]
MVDRALPMHGGWLAKVWLSSSDCTNTRTTRAPSIVRGVCACSKTFGRFAVPVCDTLHLPCERTECERLAHTVVIAVVAISCTVRSRRTVLPIAGECGMCVPAVESSVWLCSLVRLVNLAHYVFLSARQVPSRTATRLNRPSACIPVPFVRHAPQWRSVFALSAEQTLGEPVTVCLKDIVIEPTTTRYQ